MKAYINGSWFIGLIMFRWFPNRCCVRVGGRTELDRDFLS